LAVVLALLPCGALAAPATARAAPSPPARSHRLTVDGVVRTYRLHLPKSRSSTSTLVPAVIVLHGAGATGKEVERRYHWDPLADREHFVVAYPQAMDLRWNDSANPSGPDDVGFLRKLVDQLEATRGVDPSRVYVTGISNGGIMTYRAACALGDRLAAIGPVAAWFPACVPAAPISVIHIHGLHDSVLTYDGGLGAPPVEEGLARWRTVDGCPAVAAPPTAPSVSISDEVTWRTWHPCAAGTEVDLVTIATGEHEWPGAVPKPGNDPVSHAIDATGAIWAFFRAHTR
jgi:polyhydroxybutyrate depolymerase